MDLLTYCKVRCRVAKCDRRERAACEHLHILSVPIVVCSHTRTENYIEVSSYKNNVNNTMPVSKSIILAEDCLRNFNLNTKPGLAIRLLNTCIQLCYPIFGARFLVSCVVQFVRRHVRNTTFKKVEM